MLSITDLKKGALVQIDDKPYRVVDYSQKVMGRGGSIVNVRLKSLLDGAVIPKTFKGSDRLDEAQVTSRNAQFLYSAAGVYYFMDGATFEQFELTADIVGEAASYLKEGQEIMLQFFNGQVINIELPKSMYLKVTYAEDVVKGDTTSSVQKDARLETGLQLRVPAFIKTGDIIKVDTRTGEYQERFKG